MMGAPTSSTSSMPPKLAHKAASKNATNVTIKISRKVIPEKMTYDEYVIVFRQLLEWTQTIETVARDHPAYESEQAILTNHLMLQKYLKVSNGRLEGGQKKVRMALDRVQRMVAEGSGMVTDDSSASTQLGSSPITSADEIPTRSPPASPESKSSSMSKITDSTTKADASSTKATDCPIVKEEQEEDELLPSPPEARPPPLQSDSDSSKEDEATAAALLVLRRHRNNKNAPIPEPLKRAALATSVRNATSTDSRGPRTAHSLASASSYYRSKNVLASPLTPAGSRTAVPEFTRRKSHAHSLLRQSRDVAEGGKSKEDSFKSPLTAVLPSAMRDMQINTTLALARRASALDSPQTATARTPRFPLKSPRIFIPPRAGAPDPPAAPTPHDPNIKSFRHLAGVPVENGSLRLVHPRTPVAGSLPTRLPGSAVEHKMSVDKADEPTRQEDSPMRSSARESFLRNMPARPTPMRKSLSDQQAVSYSGRRRSDPRDRSDSEESLPPRSIPGGLPSPIVDSEASGRTDPERAVADRKRIHLGSPPAQLAPLSHLRPTLASSAPKPYLPPLSSATTRHFLAPRSPRPVISASVSPDPSSQQNRVPRKRSRSDIDGDDDMAVDTVAPPMSSRRFISPPAARLDASRRTYPSPDSDSSSSASPPSSSRRYLPSRPAAFSQPDEPRPSSFFIDRERRDNGPASATLDSTLPSNGTKILEALLADISATRKTGESAAQALEEVAATLQHVAKRLRRS